MSKELNKIKLSFWDSNNFGDALNTYMFKAFGVDVECCPPREADCIGIGSCADSRLLLGAIEKKIPENQSPIFIYGSGFHYPKYSHTMQQKIVKPETLIRPVIPHALRGKISKKRLEDILNSSLEGIALGDPGLLVKDIFNVENIQKKYKLGIVAHFTHKNNPAIKRIKKNINDSVVIDVLGNPYKLVKQIAQCEVLVSSAMHPLIIADGLGVPNKWLKFSTNESNRNSAKHKDVSNYKFDDYYSVFNLKPEFIDLSERDLSADNIDTIIEDYAVRKEDVDKIRKELIKAFPYSNNIKPISEKEANKMYYLYLYKAIVLRTIKQVSSIFIKGKERRKIFRRSPVYVTV
ncbi:polysaccharide pyruvyl transferase family protein [Labilibacter marinus]|uniref:polysaccharide pyruvyl transferase family protein n=1 Tax=Labilibacter marinus TaxID=1477105 RepID=UPI0008352FC5|nr:polysaccharide pyruvyl transferase family protein [Labilibacter marinus]